jgi:hypothetical protein
MSLHSTREQRNHFINKQKQQRVITALAKSQNAGVAHSSVCGALSSTVSVKNACENLKEMHGASTRASSLAIL